MSSFHENRPWDGNIGLVGLKIDWDVARAFLTEAAWTVLLPDLLNVGSDTNQDLGGPFRHFGYFLVFNSFGDTFCLNDQHGLDPICVVDQQFYFRRLFTALASVATNSGTTVIARIGGGHGI